MSKNLDKKLPYGAVYGDAEGRVFEQGGRYFVADGTPWRDPNVKETEAQRKQREKEEQEAEQLAAKAQAAESGEDDQLDKQLAG